MHRRAFLRTAVAALGLLTVRVPARGAADREGLGRTRAILEAIIREHAAAKDDPWLLIHGIRAMGKDFKVGDEPAVAYLCRSYLEETSAGGKSYLRMPIAHEGHANAFLAEAVLDSGVDASYAFRTNDRDYTVADIIAGAKALFDFDAGASQRAVTFNPDALAFSLTAFAHSTDPAQDEWINAEGKAIRLSAAAEFGLETLENANKVFEDSMRKGVVAEGPDRVHEFTCGGMHLIYGLGTCLRFGHARAALSERMQTQFDILVWRLKSDLRLTDHYYDALAGQYPAEVVLMHYLDAKLKFLGHALEVLNHARRFNLFVPTAAQEEDIARAHKELFDAVEAIGTDSPRTVSDRTLFKFLVGDACHAYRGLTIASAA
jgi:hypothetical protein